MAVGKGPRFAETVSPHQAEVLLAAALLHDVGHWPFCHPIEDMSLPELPPHESFASEFLAPNGELAEVLRSQWQVDPADVLDILVARTDKRAWRLLRSILSGPIDIDKMDYLGRDSQHAGVPYGQNFDRSRLMQSLLVNSAGDGLAISSKGKTAAELMVFARYVMFSEVYWHHAVRSATSMFARSFFSLYRDLDLQSFFRLTEAETIAQMRQQVRGTDCEPLTEGIFGPRRRLYKRLTEYSHYQQEDVYQRLAGRKYLFLVHCGEHLAAEISAQLNVELPPTAVLIDAPPPHREVEFKVDIYFPKEDVYRPLETVSPVVQALAKTQFDDYVKRVRIFIDPDLHDRVSGQPWLIDCLKRAITAAESDA